MPTAREYETAIQQLDYGGVRALWERVHEGTLAGFWAEEPGKAMEYLVLRAFQLEGADVTWPYVVKLEGAVVEQIDGVVYSHALSVLIECKDQSAPLNVEPVAKLRGQIARRPAGTVGVLFSRSGFTRPAELLTQFVQATPVLLWSGEELAYALGARRMCEGLHLKYRQAVEQAIPDYDIRPPSP